MKNKIAKLLAGVMICTGIISTSASSVFAKEATQRIIKLDSKFDVTIKWNSSKNKIIVSDKNKDKYEFTISEMEDLGAINIDDHLEMTKTDFHEFLEFEDIAHTCP